MQERITTATSARISHLLSFYYIAEIPQNSRYSLNILKTQRAVSRHFCSPVNQTYNQPLRKTILTIKAGFICLQADQRPGGTSHMAVPKKCCRGSTVRAAGDTIEHASIQERTPLHRNSISGLAYSTSMNANRRPPMQRHSLSVPCPVLDPNRLPVRFAFFHKKTPPNKFRWCFGAGGGT